MDPLTTGAVSLGTSALGSVLAGFGARKEAKRKKKAVRTHAATTSRLTDQLNARIAGEDQAQQGDLAGLLAAFGDVAGAGGDRDAAAGRVAAMAGGGPAPAAGATPYHGAVSTGYSAGMAPANEAARSWLSSALMRIIGNRTQSAGRAGQASTLGRRPGVTADIGLNRIGQANADADLQRRLGRYDGNAASMGLVGALMQGLGQLGMRGSGLMGGAA